MKLPNHRLAAVAAVFVATTTFTAFAGEKKSVDAMIESAKTPADHKALAAKFEQAASDATAQAEMHRKMGDSYKKTGGVAIAKWKLDEHCSALVAKYEALAKENSEMAKAHQQMAEQK